MILEGNNDINQDTSRFQSRQKMSDNWFLRLNVTNGRSGFAPSHDSESPKIRLQFLQKNTTGFSSDSPFKAFKFSAIASVIMKVFDALFSSDSVQVH